MRGLPPIDDPSVLVATATADDAGVYQLDDETALVQTVDFFTPIVDDPYTYGAIAAANAISDVYAMGGRPLTALAIAAFPEDMDPNVIAAVLRGGVEKSAEAGVVVLGGHTIKDDEPKYGLAVTGVVHPKRILRNATPQPGDALILSKPLGTGILTTARRSDRIDDAAMAEAIASMLALNRAAAEAIGSLRVHAMTDVTGYGLLGHLAEMLLPSGSGAEINAADVPVFEAALELARAGVAPGGTRNNLALAIDAGTAFDVAVEDATKLVLADAQTSGGLLISIAPDDAAAYLLRVPQARRIGTITERGPIRVYNAATSRTAAL